jgi:hypothetical protein
VDQLKSRRQNADDHKMASEAKSKRRVREVAYAWIGVGASYLVGAVVWVITGRWPPPGYVLWGTVFALTGWLSLRRVGMQREGSWLLRPKVWFLATSLFGVLSLVASLSVAIDPFSRALDVITALALFAVGLHAFLGEWVDHRQLNS